MTLVSLKLVVASALVLFSAEAFCCKLAASAYDLAAYLAERSENQVVFVARVASIEVFDAGPGIRAAQRITFNTSKWWRGRAKPTVIAEGFIEEPRGTSCDGIFDFSVGLDEDWLIVGYAGDGALRPWRLLSKKLVMGNVPPDLLRLLESSK